MFTNSMLSCRFERDVLLTRWLYWTDYGTVAKIQRASMDGHSRSVLHDTSLTTPYALTIDYENQILYWADYTLDKLEKSNVDGSNRLVVTTSSITSPYSLTFYEGRLYWTDLSFARIYTTLANFSSVSTLSSQGQAMYGIQAVAENRQKIGMLKHFITAKYAFYTA